MTTINKLAKEYQTVIQQLLRNAEQTLIPSSAEDEELVRRAVFAVRNKSVVFERYISRAEMLYVTVQDVRPALVEVNFMQKKIACSCPQNQMCRHQLAVLLSLYQYFDSVQDWVAQWRATKSVPLKNLVNERTPESWLKIVDEVLGRVLKPGQPLESYTLMVFHDDTMAKLMRAMPFEREWQPLFKLFMEFAVLSRVWAHLNETDAEIRIGFTAHFFVERSCERITETIEELAGKSRLFATDPFYEALQEMVRSLVLERNEAFLRRLYIYRLFWEKLLHEKPRREQELALLESQELPQPTSKDLDLTAVKAIFYILLRQPEKLTAIEENLNAPSVPYYYELALFSKQIGELWAAEQIARYILPHLNAYISSYLNPMKQTMFVHEFHLLFDGFDLSEEEELTLYGAMGKHGLQPFSMYLVKKGRFNDWAALHQQHPSSLSYLEMCGLKDVVEQAPGAVLPLLHIYALEEVRGKSRMNYKQAVRIWKKMKTVAKKAGKTAYFEDYMLTIRTQNKRLRALVEEIEKGNLLA